MCVCMYACMHANMYACIHARMNACMLHLLADGVLTKLELEQRPAKLRVAVRLADLRVQRREKLVALLTEFGEIFETSGE